MHVMQFLTIGFNLCVINSYWPLFLPISPKHFLKCGNLFLLIKNSTAVFAKSIMSWSLKRIVNCILSYVIDSPVDFMACFDGLIAKTDFLLVSNLAFQDSQFKNSSCKYCLAHRGVKFDFNYFTLCFEADLSIGSFKKVKRYRRNELTVTAARLNR